jgi:ABC-type glycerol-3-phosphate transport system substrate-binding protein
MTIANLIYYNEGILNEHGVDPASLTTWSAFTDACQIFQDAGVTPVLIGAKNAWAGGHWAQHLYIRTLGVKGAVDLFLRGLYVEHESEKRFTDPNGVRVWELIKELLDKEYFSRGVLSDDYPIAFGKLFRGDGAFFQTGGWLLGDWFANVDAEIDLKFMLMPAIDDIAESNANEVSFNARTLIVPRESEHPAEAQEFVKWYLQSEEPHRIWYNYMPGEAPPMPLSTPMENLRPESALLVELLDSAPALTIMIERAIDYNIGQEILWHGSSGVLSGALSPVEAAERAENLVLDWREERM